MPALSHLLVWSIAALATLGVILRPFRWPEAIWASLGALALTLSGLLPAEKAWHAILEGKDVYFFLVGMMLLSEVARREGLFDWVAAHSLRAAKGSSSRLFLLVYLVGVAVTALLSNDATAVVMTPAVMAVTRRAQLKPLPYLFACALIANAASFVLPISNPANLVLYAGHTPALGTWLGHFLLPSVLSITVTYLVLRWSQRAALKTAIEPDQSEVKLTSGGRTALIGIGLMAVVLLVVSSLDLELGLPTAILGVLVSAAVLVQTKKSPLPVLGGVHWLVLPLVAGLFVLVAALDHTGVITDLAALLQRTEARSETLAAAGSGVTVAFVCNLVNNLPAGLVVSSTVAAAHPSARVVDSLLIGVDLGPNLSVTGSLATILWLSVIRREGEDVGFFRFFKVGLLVMPPALLLALAARLIL